MSFRLPSPGRSVTACVAAAVIAFPGYSSGQGRPAASGHELFAGSDLEGYLRALQITGGAPLHPWSIRAGSYGPGESVVATDSAHPWAARYRLQAGDSADARVTLVRPRVQTWYNSAFPFGVNDGPVWAGRGLTVSLQAGVSARFGPISATLAPLLFWAQNADFTMMRNGYSGRMSFADGRYPDLIDLPQRFGPDPYARLDPGQSTLAAQLSGVALGVSTASQIWGPARYYPLILGSDGPGFPHAFVGTSRPVDLWIGKFHGRLVSGRLSQSGYTSLPQDSSARLMSGLVATFTPRGLPGLEIGLSRFFHSGWPDDGAFADDLLTPLGAFFKRATGDPYDADSTAAVRNQLASVFFRAAFPRSGLELYGEYGREDHNWDVRDFLLEPDHQSAYTIGLSKVWRRSERRMLALHGEVMNSQVTHISRVRPQGPFYNHTQLRQGHTQLGQTLGSPAVYGGAGSVVSAELMHPNGGWTVSWTRTVRQDDAPIMWRSGSTSQGVDAHHAVGTELLRFHRGWDLAAGVTAVYNRNRNFRSDAFNLNAMLSVTAPL